MHSTKDKMKNFRSTVFTGVKQNCSGCGACAQVCAHEAITMQEDNEGFLFPKVDSTKCVLCGLCDNTCPEVNARWENQLDFQQCYLAINKTPNVYKDCATIGLCTMLSEIILSKGGYVFGVKLDEDIWKAKHVCIDDINYLNQIKNSKYIQSDTGNTFKATKKYLKNGQIVLFIGTPCQISGLKAYLRRDYDTLYTIDIFCHGTFSYKILQKEIGYWKSMFGTSIKHFKFRSRIKYDWSYGGVVNFDVVNEKRQSKHVERHGSASPAYRLYAYSPDGKSYTLRETCYTCKFRDEGRYGDISIGDAWKIKGDHQDIFTAINRKNGISAFSCNTKKGQKLLTLCIEKVELKRIDRNDFFCQDALLPTNRDIPIERYQIYHHIEVKNWSQYIQSFFGVNLEKVQRGFERKVFVNKIKYVIKLFLRWKK